MKILNKKQVSEYSQMKVYQLSSEDQMFLLMVNSSFFQQGFGTKLLKVDLSTAPSFIAKISLTNRHLYFLQMANLYSFVNSVPNFSRKHHKKLDYFLSLTTWSSQWQLHQLSLFTVLNKQNPSMLWEIITMLL